MEILLLLLLVSFVCLGPFVLMLVGWVYRANKEETVKKKGTRLIKWGAIWLVSELLIGFAICSTLDPGSFH